MIPTPTPSADSEREISVPVEPTEALLRPFYECPPDELRLAWAAMVQVAKVAARTLPPAIESASGAEAAMRELLVGLVEIWDKKARGRAGSPNHAHNIPGIWDSDNGELANKPCAECALYDKARAIAASPPPAAAQADAVDDGIKWSLPALDQLRSLPYSAIRYVPGYPEEYVREYAANAVRAALATKEAGEAPAGYEKMRGGKPVVYWRDDALESAALIVEAYFADKQIASDIRAMKKDRHFAKSVSAVELAKPAAAEAPAVDGVWRAALTLANNLCVQTSDRYNGDDATAEADAAAECARQIRGYLEPGAEELAHLLNEAGVRR